MVRLHHLRHIPIFVVIMCLPCILCSGTPRPAVPIVRCSGINVCAGPFNERLCDALSFVRDHDPAVHTLINTFIKKITWKDSPIWSFTHFPDTISISNAALGRGTTYIASILYHETLHIMIFKMRLQTHSETEAALIQDFFKRQRRPLVAITGLDAFREEKLTHRLQLDFLIRHRDFRRAEIQREIIRHLDRTYRHLLDGRKP